MNITPILAPDHERFTSAFDKLSDRDALRLLRTLAGRFSGYSYGFDQIDSGIERVAVDLAQEDGWLSDQYSLSPERDLADRFLSGPSSFQPSFELAVMVAPGKVFL